MPSKKTKSKRPVVRRTAPPSCSTLLLVFKWCGNDKVEFQGVFDTEKKAVSACVTNCHCVCPATLNKKLPQRRTVWPGAWYPRLQARPSNPTGHAPARSAAEGR